MPGAVVRGTKLKPILHTIAVLAMAAAAPQVQAKRTTAGAVTITSFTPSGRVHSNSVGMMSLALCGPMCQPGGDLVFQLHHETRDGRLFTFKPDGVRFTEEARKRQAEFIGVEFKRILGK